MPQNDNQLGSLNWLSSTASSNSNEEYAPSPQQKSPSLPNSQNDNLF